MDLPSLTSTISGGRSLESPQAEAAADLLASPDIPASDKAAFLTALSRKGETADEISGLARRFRALARDPGLDAWRERAIDVCGTGGDKLGTFNISTTVAFVLAAAGVPVFKHGNRSVTSKCGSANLLEALGVDLMADDATLRRSMEELGFCFMFAPAFHPAFKAIMPVRQSLAAAGQRTVFNFLGPLLNPARPAFQLLGVFDLGAVDVIADALHQLGVEGGLVAHCRIDASRGLDELSAAGENRVRGFGSRRSIDARWSASDLGLAPASLGELQGGDLEDNVDLLEALLDGRAPRGLEDTVSLNVAAAFHIVGRHDSVAAGLPEARELLLGGATRAKLEQTKDFFAKA